MEKILGINVKYDNYVLSSQNILENSNLLVTALITHNVCNIFYSLSVKITF